MDVFDSLEKLDIEPDWCILEHALEWGDEDPLVTAAEVQRYAADLLAANADESALAVAILHEDDIAETHAVTRELAEQCRCDGERAAAVVLLVAVHQWADTDRSDDPVAAISALVSIFNDPQRATPDPDAVQVWRAGTGDPSSFWSATGYERLRADVSRWIDTERARLTQPNLRERFTESS